MKKTKEELAAERKKKTIEMLSGPRTAYNPTMLEPAKEVARATVAKGLELSDLQTRPIEWFKPNPANTVFDALKTPKYWEALKRDIREARTIVNPLIALPDGTLLEGHSRLKVAQDLREEGLNLGRLPVLVVASKISGKEAEQRVYLGNLSRFEIDEDTRLALYARIWPDYFLTQGSAGRPGKSGHGVPISGDSQKPRRKEAATAGTIAAAVGKSEKQVKRDRQIVQKAHAQAKAEGKSSPDASHVAKARASANAQRRKKTPAEIRISAVEATLLYSELRTLWKRARGEKQTLLERIRKLSESIDEA